MFDYIMNGGISIHPSFFEQDKFLQIKNDIDNLDYKEDYQPGGTDIHYGNRFQAFPCYQSTYYNEKEYIINKLEGVLNRKIVDYKTIARKTILEEVKKSKVYGKYGFVHRDIDNPTPLIAGMMYFDQAFDGGTAFFENSWDKVSDIYVSAYPNRLVLYCGSRWHAPAFDYTYEERKTLSFFLTIGE